MEHAVSQLMAPERLTAVIAETTTWEAFSTLWSVLLGEVWATVRAHPEIAPGRNVMLYKDDVPNVEVGVEVAELFEPIGRVVPGTLPGGLVATTVHRGRYEDLGAAHGAVVDWCRERALLLAGPRWEVYGHVVDESVTPEVEIFYLLR